VYQRLPGYRPEIIEGRLTVNPPPDIRHAKSLSRLQTALGVLTQHDVDVVQGVGLWLPTGEDDYVIPDLAVVDADAEDLMPRLRAEVARLAGEIETGTGDVVQIADRIGRIEIHRGREPGTMAGQRTDCRLDRTARPHYEYSHRVSPLLTSTRSQGSSARPQRD
jgi:hypothetical protein